MATGVVISAPAVVLSVVMGLERHDHVLLMALPTALYTMFGGVQAVAWTDVKQMVLIVGGLVAAVVVLVARPARRVGVGEALQIAGTTGRLQTFDFRSTSPTATPSGPAPSRRCSCSAPTSAPTRARCSATSRPSRWTRRARRC